MSELLKLKSLVLAQQEIITQLRNENNQLKINRKFGCDNHCRKVDLYCTCCSKLLCEECEIRCERCDEYLCQTCSRKHSTLTCNHCHIQVVICNNCWTKDTKIFCVFCHFQGILELQNSN